MSLRMVSTDTEETPLLTSLIDEPGSREIFRQLFAALDLPAESEPIIGITSAIAGEGCTTIALNLARTLAQDLDSMVSLVEVNFGSPTLTQRYELHGSPGLAEVLRGEHSIG